MWKFTLCVFVTVHMYVGEYTHIRICELGKLFIETRASFAFRFPISKDSPVENRTILIPVSSTVPAQIEDKVINI